jgi:putative transposase
MRAGPRAAEHAQAELVAEIRTIHADSAGTYGSPRVTHELRRRGWRVNHKRVERLMATHGIVGHRPRRRRGLTKPDAAAPPAPDLLGRLFDPDRIDVAWCGDVTFIPTDEGWLYLASVLDLASRHLLGWSMGAHHDAGLVTDALQACGVRKRVHAARRYSWRSPPSRSRRRTAPRSSWPRPVSRAGESGGCSPIARWGR